MQWTEEMFDFRCNPPYTAPTSALYTESFPCISIFAAELLWGGVVPHTMLFDVGCADLGHEDLATVFGSGQISRRRRGKCSSLNVDAVVHLVDDHDGVSPRRWTAFHRTRKDV